MSRDVPGPVPPYEERAEWLIQEAARVMVELDKLQQNLAPQWREDVERWLNNYELHVCQIDHPAVRPQAMPETIDGEVTG